MHAAAPSLPPQANPHFLKALIDLSAQQDIEVSEDVYNANGIKLLARGTKVSAKLYGQVVSHKLRKPIETSLIATAPPDNATTVAAGERLLDELPLLRRLSNWSFGKLTPLSILGETQMAGPAATLQCVANARSEQSARHSVLVALLAMGLARAHRYNDEKLCRAAAVAGLFHDVGELYVDPAALNSGQLLSAKDWMSYCSHSIIGAALAREIAGFDTVVQRAILEHHERLDGFGYPRGLRNAEVSELGRILGLAETLSALIHLPGAERRIDIALKIMPGEYEPSMVSMLKDLLHEAAQEVSDPASAVGSEILDSIHETFARIAQSLDAFQMASATTQTLTAATAGAIEEAYSRFIRVQRAFASTGIAGLGDLGMCVSEAELRDLRFEAMCVLAEIKWRLLKLSRELVLKGASLSPAERESLASLAEVLAGA